MITLDRTLKQTTAFVSFFLLTLPVIVIAETKSVYDNDPTWIIDPKSTEPDLPPAGRSLFDFVVAEKQSGQVVFNIPFPFSTLLDKIDQTLEKNKSDYPGIKKVLIPLGRSLQRSASGKEFFEYPRAVAVVDAEPKILPDHAGMLLKDRLYLGYHEKSNILEIISYNETAGRFEFQLVKDYREGGTPEFYYAPRAICTACHQNHSPIFSRPTWEETSANPVVKIYLKASGKSFYGFDLNHGVDIPNAIDEATDRANLFSLQQWLWREGCGLENTEESVKCRAGLLTAMLQYRLSDKRHFDVSSDSYRNDVLPIIQKNWRQHWPQGISIPNPDIPNRDPFLKHVKSKVINPQSLNLINVETSFEPIKSRPPLKTWKSLNTETISEIVSGLSGFIAAPDVKKLDRHLSSLVNKNTIREVFKAKCQLKIKDKKDSQRISFDCPLSGRSQNGFSARGRLYINDGEFNRCTIERLHISGSRHKNIQISDGAITPNEVTLKLKDEDLSIYLNDGSFIETINFKRQESSTNKDMLDVEGTLTLVDTFSPAVAAINTLKNQTLNQNSDTLTSQPFRRSSVMSALFKNLNMPALKWCCEDITGFPQAKLELQANQPTDNNIPEDIPKGFIEHCAHCHFSREHFPPNFLYGDIETVKSNFSQCAERIFYRLGMWRLDPGTRPKTAMPPDLSLLRHNINPDTWKNSSMLNELQNYISKLLKQQTGKEPRLANFANRDYEHLRSCLQ